MTHYTRVDLAMAERHVAEGERHVVRQEELLSVLRAHDHPTESAEALLTLFYAMLFQHRLHCSAIAEALEAHDPD